MNSVSESLFDTHRTPFYAIIGGVWLIVAVFAIVHDQLIVTMNPEHFTMYHPRYFNLQQPHLKAMVYAFLAAIGPGIFLGFVLFFAARYGAAPRISVRRVLSGTVRVICIAEICALCTGLYVYHTGNLIYPDTFYPVITLIPAVTQTIQITAYLAGALASVVFIVYILYRRILTVSSQLEKS